MANARFGVNILPKNNTETLGNSDHPWTIVSPALTGTPTAPTAADGTKTSQIATTEFVQNAKEGMLDDIVAPEYDSTATYEVGEYCTHDGDLYKCNTAIDVAEDWTAAHWDKISITEELGKLTGYTNIISGTIANFPDGADGLPMTVTAEIVPVQDLHGQESPWPGGGGKNLIDKSQFTGTTVTVTSIEKGVTVTVSNAGNNRFAVTELPLSLVGKTVTFHADVSVGSTNYPSMRLYYASPTSLIESIVSIGSKGSVTQTIEIPNEVPEGTTRLLLLLYACTTGTTSVGTYTTYDNLQLELGSTANPYVPYENICPISGWTGANVTRTGKNLLDESIITFTNDKYINIDTGVIGDTTEFMYTNEFTPVDAGTNYTFFVHKTVTSKNRCPNIIFYDENKKFIANSSFNIGEAGKLAADFTNTFQIPSGAYYARFDIPPYTAGTLKFAKGNDVDGAVSDVAETYSITFPDSAGTVYGGTLTVNKDGTGKLVSDMVFVDLDNLSWTKHGTNPRIAYTYVTDHAKFINKTTPVNGVCSIYKVIAQTQDDPNVIGISFNTEDHIYIRDDNISELNSSGVSTYLAGQKLAYELATPVEIDLTELEVIETLKGVNNVWADCGEIKVEYMTDSGIASYIKMKSDKVSGATNGNFAGLDSNGNLTDSGKKASDFALADEAVTSIDYDTTNKKITKTVNGLVSDIVSVNTIKTDLGKFTWGQLAGKSDPT